jgi:hypothetical protein
MIGLMNNPNKPSNHTKSLQVLAAVSAIAVTYSGIGVSEASTSSTSLHTAVRTTESQIRHRETPFKVLTGLLATLERGGHVEIAAEDITVPGPIGSATGQPLAFKANGGHHYLAYTQGQEPNFNQKQPADVAADMAIVTEPAADVDMHLEEAYLDKGGILVDGDQIAVGYVTGGNSGK